MNSTESVSVLINYHVNEDGSPCADGVASVWAACKGLVREHTGERLPGEAPDYLTMLGANVHNTTIAAAKYSSLAESTRWSSRTFVAPRRGRAPHSQAHVLYLDCHPVQVARLALAFMSLLPEKGSEEYERVVEAAMYDYRHLGGVNRYMVIQAMEQGPSKAFAQAVSEICGASGCATTVHIIDHHSSAVSGINAMVEFVQLLKDRPSPEWSNVIDLNICYDVQKSGCELVADYIYGESPPCMSALLNAIGSYDTWRHDEKHGSMLTHMLRESWMINMLNQSIVDHSDDQFLQALQDVDKLAEAAAELAAYEEGRTDALKPEGKAESMLKEWKYVLIMRDRYIKKKCAQVEKMTFNGTDGHVGIVLVEEWANEVADYMLHTDRRMIAACCIQLSHRIGSARISFRTRKHDHIRTSERAEEDCPRVQGASAAEMARHLGGGGHATAAGATLKGPGGYVPSMLAIRKAVYTAYKTYRREISVEYRWQWDPVPAAFVRKTKRK